MREEEREGIEKQEEEEEGEEEERIRGRNKRKRRAEEEKEERQEQEKKDGGKDETQYRENGIPQKHACAVGLYCPDMNEICGSVRHRS